VEQNIVGHQGDLLALTLLEASLRDDLSTIDLVLSELGVSEATPEVLGTIRCLCTALATTLQLNLGPELAREQVLAWRRVMVERTSRMGK
jgi:hypothetical protein